MDYFVVDHVVSRLNLDSYKDVQPININITLNLFDAYTGNTYVKCKTQIYLVYLFYFLK